MYGAVSAQGCKRGWEDFSCYVRSLQLGLHMCLIIVPTILRYGTAADLFWQLSLESLQSCILTGLIHKPVCRVSPQVISGHFTKAFFLERTMPSVLVGGFCFPSVEHVGSHSYVALMHT